MTGLREDFRLGKLPLYKGFKAPEGDALSELVYMQLSACIFLSINFLLYSLSSASSPEFVLDWAGKTRQRGPNCWVLWYSG